MAQARHWCFTLNNPDGLLDCEQAPKSLHYCVYQEEIGENGTNHFQGYLQFNRPVRLAAIKRWISGAHLSVANGTPEQNITYCTKEDTRIGESYIWGEPTYSQGERSDIKALKRYIDEGHNLREISDSYFREYLKFNRGIKEYMLLHFKPTRKRCDLHIYFGPTGTGKSNLALEEASKVDDCPLTLAAPNSEKNPVLWFDGYYGQRAIIIDDFESWWMSPAQFKRMVNSITSTVNVKGAIVPLTPDLVIITSNFDPATWYAMQHWDAISRRITLLREFTAYKTYIEAPDYVSLARIRQQQ